MCGGNLRAHCVSGVEWGGEGAEGAVAVGAAPSPPTPVSSPLRQALGGGGAGFCAERAVDSHHKKGRRGMAFWACCSETPPHVLTPTRDPPSSHLGNGWKPLSLAVDLQNPLPRKGNSVLTLKKTYLTGFFLGHKAFIKWYIQS